MRLSFLYWLNSFQSLNTASQHGGAREGWGPERLGPQGGVSPALASFTGLRSGSLIPFLSFFFFIWSLIDYLPLLVVCVFLVGCDLQHHIAGSKAKWMRSLIKAPEAISARALLAVRLLGAWRVDTAFSIL